MTSTHSPLDSIPVSVSIREFQKTIKSTFHAKDAQRGIAGTFMWFTEEVGELARALKRGVPDRENLLEEFGDVLAWLSTLASLAEIDLEEAAERYMTGCPKCAEIPCGCGEETRFQRLLPGGAKKAESP